MDLRIFKSAGRILGQDGLVFQAVKRRHLAGQRAKRRNLNFLFSVGLLKFLHASSQSVFCAPQLVNVRDLDQHPGVGAGNAGKAQQRQEPANNDYVEVIKGDFKLPDLSFGIARNEKDVKTLMQSSSAAFLSRTKVQGGRWFQSLADPAALPCRVGRASTRPKPDRAEPA